MCNSAIYAIFHQLTFPKISRQFFDYFPKLVDTLPNFVDTRPAQVDNHPKLVDIYKFDTFNF